MIKQAHVNLGDYLSRTSYIRVTNKSDRCFTVQNEDGVTWMIDGNILEKECISASYFDKVVTMSRSEAIAKFAETGDRCFTVNFNKKVDFDEAYDTVKNTGKLLTNKELREKLKNVMAGEERTLIGYAFKRDNAWGRTIVRDLEQCDADKFRQVDHRTINWFICDGVKYLVR